MHRAFLLIGSYNPSLPLFSSLIVSKVESPLFFGYHTSKVHLNSACSTTRSVLAVLNFASLDCFFHIWGNTYYLGFGKCSFSENCTYIRHPRACYVIACDCTYRFCYFVFFRSCNHPGHQIIMCNIFEYICFI